MCVLSVNETKKVAREEGRPSEPRGAVVKNRTTKRKQNRTKISRALAESFFFSPRQKKRKFRQTSALVLEFERTLPPSRCARFFFPLRLAIPLINETPYASFITFVVPLWIRPKSFEPAPHLSASTNQTQPSPLPPPAKRDNTPNIISVVKCV